MNKAELIKSIAVGANVPQPVAAKMLTSLQEAVTNTVTHGDKVSIRGFGSFTVSDRAARCCCHPKTGEVMQTKAFRTVRLSPAEN